MAVGRYYKYKCKKCGYTFTKYQSDVFMPVSCPKCGGEVEIVSSSMIRNPLEEVVDIVKNVFRKEKKWKSFI